MKTIKELEAEREKTKEFEIDVYNETNQRLRLDASILALKDVLKLIDEMRLEINTKRKAWSKERWAGKIDMLIELKQKIQGENGNTI